MKNKMVELMKSKGCAILIGKERVITIQGRRTHQAELTTLKEKFQQSGFKILKFVLIIGRNLALLASLMLAVWILIFSYKNFGDWQVVIFGLVIVALAEAGIFAIKYFKE